MYQLLCLNANCMQLQRMNWYLSVVAGAVGVTAWIVVCRNVVSKVGAELQ